MPERLSETGRTTSRDGAANLHDDATSAGWNFCSLPCRVDLPLERDFERLLGAYGRTNVSSAGAGIGTGSDFPLNRSRTAELLGFDDVCQNVRDANAGRDFVLEAQSAITILMVNVAWATDTIFLFCSNEFNFVEIANRYCGSSSIMPQKKNPHSLMVVSETASHLSGAMSAM